MPITPYLSDVQKFDAETRRVMGVAFEMVLAALRLSDRADPIVGIIAHRIIALAKDGQDNPDLICEQAMASLGFRPPPAPKVPDIFQLPPVWQGGGQQGSDSGETLN